MTTNERIVLYFPTLAIAAYWGLFKVALPIFPVLSGILHTSDRSFQYIMSLAFIFSGLSPVLWGALIDGIKAKTFIVWVLLAAIFSLIPLTFTSSVIQFGVCYIAGCIALQGLLVCARVLPLTCLKNNPAAVKKSFALMMLGGYSAAFLAPFVGGYLYHTLNWHWVFAVVPVFLTGMLFLACKLRDEQEGKNKIAMWENIRQLYRLLCNKPFTKNMLFIPCYTILVQSYYIAVPFWLARQYHVPPQHIAYYLFPMLFPGMIAPWIFNRVKAFFSEQRIILLALGLFLCAGLIPLIYIVSPLSGWVCAVPGILMTVGTVFLGPIIYFYTLSAAGTQKNAASSLLSLVIYGSGGLGIYLTSFIGMEHFYLEGFLILIMTAMMLCLFFHDKAQYAV